MVTKSLKIQGKNQKEKYLSANPAVLGNKGSRMTIMQRMLRI